MSLTNEPRAWTEAQLRGIREADPAGQGRHSFTAQQQTLRRLDATFRAFFKRVKTVEKGPGRNVAQKAGLNRSILDAGWRQFTSILVAKAESAGRRVVRVDPRYTSLDCHACGSRCARPRQDTVVRPNCGDQDADLNGARNIATRAGLGSGQALVA